MPPYSRFPLKIILLSWMLVGTLDLSAAFVDVYLSTGKDPFSTVLKYIASGLMGDAAFSGSTGTMLLGLALHYFFALCFTVFFFWVYPRMNLQRYNRVLTGVVYGLLIWMLMNLIVVQLSSVPHGPVSSYKIARILKAAAILIVMIGLPLSYIARKYFTGKMR